MTQAEKDNEKNASTGVDIEEADDNDNDNDHSGTIEAESNEKDDCSDLTDNNEDTEEQAPKSFPLKVSELSCSNLFQFVSGS